MKNDITHPRYFKIQRLIERHLIDCIHRHLNDPLCHKANITRVVLSSDYSHAKVFVLLRNEVEDATQVVSALNKASGFLRRYLAKTIALRGVPKLRFLLDQDAERVSRLTEILDGLPEEESVA